MPPRLRVIENETIASVERAQLALAVTALERIRRVARRARHSGDMTLVDEIATDTLGELRR